MKKRHRTPLPRCGDKVCYPSEMLALHVLLRSSRATGRAFLTYRCAKCGMWHLTSKVQVTQ